MLSAGAPSGHSPTAHRVHAIHKSLMKNKFVRPLVISPLLLAVSAAVLVGCSEPPASPAAAAPQVGVHAVQAKPLTLVTVLPGRSAAYRIAEVRPQVNGIVEKRQFDEGAQVKKGQQLYQIDDAVHQAEYNRAKANLVTTERLAKRYQRLEKTSAISQQQYDDAMSAWKQAQAQAELARINLVYTKVLSPISGRVGRSNVSEGALVTSGQATEMVTVQQIDPIYVDVQQPVAEVLRLRKEMANGRLELAGEDQAKATLKMEDGSLYPHTGTLQFSEITVNPGTSSVTLRAEFPNPDGDLLPGMFVQTQLNEGVRNDAILVPQQAVSRDQMGEASVWVVGADNKVERRPIVALRTVGNQWLVGGGLADGEQVVTEGVQRLRNGIEVVAAPAENVSVVMDFSDPSQPEPESATQAVASTGQADESQSATPADASEQAESASKSETKA